MKQKSNTPFYAKYLVKLVRPFPNFDFSFIKPLRKKAIDLLNLKKGNRVLDAGCGSGGSFPFLNNAIGETGEIVAVEISADVIINTKKRIVKNNWKNIIVIESPAEDAVLNGEFDGLLMFAAPDVYASSKALSNILPHIKSEGRIVFFGAKTTNNRFAKILNPLFKKSIPKLSFETTPIPNDKPWELFEKVMTNLEVKEYFFGLMFLASGDAINKR